MRHIERKIIYGLLIAVAVYAAAALYADIDALGSALATFAWPWFAASLVLSTGNYVLRFFKWEVYLRLLGVRIPMGRSALIFTAGFVMSITPGKMGEVLKSVLLRQTDGVPFARTAPVVFVERLTDFIALIVLAMIGVGTYSYGEGALVVSAALVAVGLALIAWPAAVESALGLVGRVPVVSRFVPKLREAWESARLLLRPLPLFTTSVLSILGWGLEGVATWCIVRGFDGAGVPIDVDVPAAVFVFSITTLLGAVSFMPGGLGVSEVSMIGVLALLHMIEDEPVATAVTLLTRGATLWWAVLWGFVAFVVFQRVARRYQPPADEPSAGAGGEGPPGAAGG